MVVDHSPPTGVAALSLGGGLQKRRTMKGAALRMDCAAIAVELGPQEIKARLSDMFDILEQLGQGSAGVVHRAVRLSDKKEVAVKKIRAAGTEFKDIMRNEFTILSSVNHPNIIRAFDFFETSGFLVLVLELFRGVSLKSGVNHAPGGRLTEARSKELCRMLLCAVDHLHRRRIVHRDVKATNILVSHDWKDLKLVDFNTARRLLDGGALTMTGTFEYMAPEVLLGESPSESTDVWSLGLCLHFMLAGKLPYHHIQFATSAEFRHAVATRPVPLRGGHWAAATEACRGFLGQCLTIDKSLRPPAMVLLEHEWLAASPPTVPAEDPACGGGGPCSAQAPPPHGFQRDRRSKSAPPA